MQDRSADIAERFFPQDQLVTLLRECKGVLGYRRLLRAIDRDWNAARNILHAAVVGGGFDNVAGYSERRTGKLTEISK